MLFSALILAQLIENPNPSPSPSYPTIATVRVTNYCTALKNLAVPIGFVTRKNSEGFLALEQPIVNIIAQNRGVTSAGSNELNTTLQNGEDDAMTYNAGNTVSMEQISKITWQIDQNLVLEDQVMQNSWKEFPKGKDPEVDKLRQRLQNLIDLQNAMDDVYTQLASTYLDNTGQASLTSDTAASKAPASDNTGQNQATLKAQLRDAIYGQVAALVEANKAATVSDKAHPLDDASDLAHKGSTAAVARELTLQELAFSNDVVVGSQRCGLVQPEQP